MYMTFYVKRQNLSSSLFVESERTDSPKVMIAIGTAGCLQQGSAPKPLAQLQEGLALP